MKRLLKLFFIFLILTIFSSCATGGPKFTELNPTIPIKPDIGRIFIYRSSAFGAAIQPDVKLNGKVVGPSTPYGFFYVDRPPGAYEILTSTEVDRKLSLTLDNGQTRFVRLNISLGFFVGHVYPELVDQSVGEKEIQDCHYTGKDVNIKPSNNSINFYKKESDFKTISILEKSFHMGDNNIGHYESTKPDGIEFISTFTKPVNGYFEAQLYIAVSDMVPNKHKEFSKGNYKSRLYINNTEFAVLNDYIEGTEDSLTIKEIHIDIDKSILVTGSNEIKIVAGYRPDKKNYDDFQIHKIEFRYRNPN